MDAAHHAVRAQGPRGAARATRARGAPSTARTRERVTWAEAREREARRARLRPTQPYVLVVGGGQGGIALGARLRQLGVPSDRHRQARPSRRPVAQPLQVAVPARPGLVRPPAVPEVPRQLAGVLPEGQDRRLAGVLRHGDGAQLLDQHRRRTARRTTRPTREWTVDGRAGRQAARCCAPSSWCSPPACPASRTCPTFPGMDVFRGDQHHSSAHPGPDAYTGKKVRRHRLEQLGVRHLRRAVGGGRRRHDGAALLDAHRPVRLADGDRARRALLRGGGGRRDDHREGRPDLRVAAVPDHARVPDPALRPDARARPGLLRPAGEGRLRPRLGRRRLRAVHEVPAPRLRLLHRRRRRRPGRRRRGQAGRTARSTELTEHAVVLDGRHRAARPTSSSTPPATGR